MKLICFVVALYNAMDARVVIRLPSDIPKLLLM
jgi:hypothetical protein